MNVWTGIDRNEESNLQSRLFRFLLALAEISIAQSNTNFAIPSLGIEKRRKKVKDDWLRGGKYSLLFSTLKNKKKKFR